MTMVKQDVLAPTLNGVQSVERAFAILEEMARAGGEMGITELSEKLDLPVPTIHRAIKTLVSLGYAKRNDSRRYSLGSSLLFLGDAASRGIGSWAKPALLALANISGETVNLAVLEGDQIVYVAQSPSRHYMRMFTEAGRRVLPHACGVGKAILAQLPDGEVEQILRNTGMPRYTQSTITTWPKFRTELIKIRKNGFALDEGEQEVGVRCLSVPIAGISPRSAMSISGPVTRVTDNFIERFTPKILESAKLLSEEFSREDKHMGA